MPVHHGQSVLDAPGWITGHLMRVPIAQDIGQIVETMNKTLKKKILYHYRATNVYNYAVVHNTPNRPSYTVGRNTPNKLELYIIITRDTQI